MKIYRNQEEFEAEIKDNLFSSNESIDINAFKLDINASIIVNGDIKAWDINAWNIKAWNINAGDIKASDIKARDIKARDINARDINAEKVEYYAVAFAYQNIKATSIKGERGNSQHFALDGKIEIKKVKVPEELKSQGTKALD